MLVLEFFTPFNTFSLWKTSLTRQKKFNIIGLKGLYSFILKFEDQKVSKFHTGTNFNLFEFSN